MTDASVDTRNAPRLARTLWIAAGILGFELLTLSLLYKNGFTFECRAMGPAWFCQALSEGVIRAMVTGGVLGVLIMARSALREAIVAAWRAAPSAGWAGAQIGGFIAILAPFFFLSDASSPATFALAAACWVAGLALTGAGTLLTLVAPSGWRAAAGAVGVSGAAMIGTALLAPEIASAVQWFWTWPFIAEITFHAAGAVLALSGQDVVAVPEQVALGLDDFVVLVGPQCSGVEGFALITGFLVLYMALFRDRLRFPHVLILLPVGILLSWCFNVVRIAVLIWIGKNVSPNLAIEGFHSHAGWLMFTVLSLSLALTVHMIGWFQRDVRITGPDVQGTVPRAGPPPLFEDPIAAQILPFAVFMGSALIASTFSETPTVVYPLRACAMVFALLMFHRVLRAMDWRVDRVAPAVGLGIGALWIATAPAAEETDMVLSEALGALGAGAFALWVVARMVGTVLLVPIIEELFFRGYMLAKLDTGGPIMRLAAIAISSGLFAALHDRWIAAGLAGVAFALLTLRTGRLSDAIVGHGIANAVIAGAAVLGGGWHLL